MRKFVKKIILVIQEGGSSTEMYVHAHENLKQARADRRSCAKAAYRTSELIKVPEALSLVLQDFPGAEAEFYRLLEEVLKARLSYPKKGD